MGSPLNKRAGATNPYQDHLWFTRPTGRHVRLQSVQNTKMWSDLLVGLGILTLSVLLLLLGPGTGGPLRVGVAFIALLFVPGYAAAAALFPLPRDTDLVSRVALTLGLSIAALPLIALVLNATPWGITPASTAIALLILTALLSGVALLRRSRADVPEGFGLIRHLYARRIVVAFSAVVVSIGLVGALTTGLRAQSTFTEFYALGDTGRLDRYPGPGPSGQMLSVRLGVLNRERTATRYTITSSSCGQTVGLPLLESGQEWRGVLECRRPAAARALTFELHREGSAAPYRNLTLSQSPTPSE